MADFKPKVLGVLGGLLVLLLLISPVAAKFCNWQVEVDKGFNNPSNHSVGPLHRLDGKLYAGTMSPGGNAEVYEKDGADWTLINSPGFGNGSHDITEIVDYNGALYVSTGNYYEGGGVWKYEGGMWTQINSSGFGDKNTYWVYSLASVENSRKPKSGAVKTVKRAKRARRVKKATVPNGIYAGTYNGLGGQVWYYDGSDWNPISPVGFGDGGNVSIQKLLYNDGYLYASTANGNGAEVWRYNGSNWVKLGGDGLDVGPMVNTAHDLEVVQGKLYAGVANAVDGAQVMLYKKPLDIWIKVNPSNFGNPENKAVYSLQSLGYAKYMLAGTQNNDEGAEVWLYNGVQWRKIAGAGFGNANELAVRDMLYSDNALYGSTWNSVEGGSIWKASVIKGSR